MFGKMFDRTEKIRAKLKEIVNVNKKIIKKLNFMNLSIDEILPQYCLIVKNDLLGNNSYYKHYYYMLSQKETSKNYICFLLLCGKNYDSSFQTIDEKEKDIIQIIIPESYYTSSLSFVDFYFYDQKEKASIFVPWKYRYWGKEVENAIIDGCDEVIKILTNVNEELDQKIKTYLHNFVKNNFKHKRAGLKTIQKNITDKLEQVLTKFKEVYFQFESIIRPIGFSIDDIKAFQSCPIIKDRSKCFYLFLTKEFVNPYSNSINRVNFLITKSKLTIYENFDDIPSLEKVKKDGDVWIFINENEIEISLRKTFYSFNRKEIFSAIKNNMYNIELIYAIVDGFKELIERFETINKNISKEFSEKKEKHLQEKYHILKKWATEVVLNIDDEYEKEYKEISLEELGKKAFAQLESELQPKETKSMLPKKSKNLKNTI